MKSPVDRSSICAFTVPPALSPAGADNRSRPSTKFSQVTTLALFVSAALHSRERYGTADIGAPTATISVFVLPSSNRILPQVNAQTESYSFVPNGNDIV